MKKFMVGLKDRRSGEAFNLTVTAKDAEAAMSDLARTLTGPDCEYLVAELPVEVGPDGEAVESEGY